MSQPCVNCGFQNPADAVFCVRCGKNVKDATGTTGNFSATGASSFASQGYQAQSMQPPQSTTFSSPPGQMGSTSSTAPASTTPHAFAGKGDFLTYYTWFLPGDALKAADLRSAVLENLLLRKFLHLNISTARLQENGHWLEERDYIIMKRGVATCFVYVAPAGQDLHISRAITVQLSFDPMRIVIVSLIAAEVFLGPSIMQNIVTVATASAGGPSSAVGFILIASVLALLYLPSLLFMVIFLVASLKHWLTQRDFWVYLRRNVLHDFELDDVSLLADATYETVLAATKQVNGDATKITLPAQNDNPKRRVRLI